MTAMQPMIDPFGWRITYLRVSVTDRCAQVMGGIDAADRAGLKIKIRRVCSVRHFGRPASAQTLSSAVIRHRRCGAETPRAGRCPMIDLKDKVANLTGASSDSQFRL
jgi:hypothetical protein